jgi:DNA-binding transcriptional regulator YiaG
VIFVEAEREKKIEMSSRIAPSRKPSVAQMHGRETQKSERQAEMTPAQCRAARGLLDWTQSRLAGASGLAVSTVVRFERNERVVPAGTVQAMQLALEAAGVEFIGENGSGAGVRMKKAKLN